MIRILLYPSIAHPSKQINLFDRSYIQFLSLFIHFMLRKRQDIFWYIITPITKGRRKDDLKEIKSKLNFNNTKLINIDIPKNPFNRIHFNIHDIKRELKLNEYSIDFIFCHQPEIAKQLKLFFKTDTIYNPPMIGYIHLFELPKIDWEDVFEFNIFGISEMDICFVNTTYQKQMIHEEARKIFSSSVCGGLHEKIKVLPPVVIPKNINQNRTGRYEKIIIWNHEVNKRKNFIDFVNTIMSLRKQRDDFKVWFPMMKSSHKLTREYRWIVCGGAENRKIFLENLRKCCVGVSPKTTYGEWKKATIEGNANGIPYLMYDEEYYRNINNDGDFFKTRKDLVLLLNKYLSKQDYRNEMAGKAIGNLITKHDLKRKVDAISKEINNIQKNKNSNRTKITNKIVALIKSHKKISLKELLGKKYLNWDNSIKFDSYRKTILNTKGITENVINSKSKKYEWKSVYKYKRL